MKKYLPKQVAIKLFPTLNENSSIPDIHKELTNIGLHTNKYNNKNGFLLENTDLKNVNSLLKTKICEEVKDADIPNIVDQIKNILDKLNNPTDKLKVVKAIGAYTKTNTNYKPTVSNSVMEETDENNTETVSKKQGPILALLNDLAPDDKQQAESALRYIRNGDVDAIYKSTSMMKAVAEMFINMLNLDERQLSQLISHLKQIKSV